MTTLDLATAARRTKRKGHARRIEQHSINVAVGQLREQLHHSTRRQNAMIRICGSLVVLLACFAVAIGQHWMNWQMAGVTLVGALAFVSLFAEFKSDRH